MIGEYKKMKHSYLIKAFILTSLPICGADVGHDRDQWTWFHRKVFTQAEQEAHKTEKSYACAKVDLPSFTQLVFSWQALRPQKGHYTFYAQVRNAGTKKWSKWHRMFNWGAQVQKSFLSEPDKVSGYHHVRLESNSNILADAFAIKVEVHNGADLSLLKSIAINVANLRDFAPESWHIMESANSVLIKGVPKYSQFQLDHPRNDGLCSPTSCAMLAGYLTKTAVDPIQFAEKSFDSGLDKYGSWPFNMAHAFEISDGKILYAVARLPSFKNLYAHLCKNIPVVVSVRGYMHGALRPYANGHLLVVIGYDAKTKEVICNDPAMPESKQVQKRYPLKSFLQAWERSHRLAYLADPIT